MATIGNTVVTLTDVAKTMDPNGKIATVVELLKQQNEVLLDMNWMEGNLPTGHRTTVRTGLPAVSWRLLNKGVAKSKGRNAQIDEACGILEARNEVDVDLANLNGNVGAFRMTEAQAFLEAMNQEMTQTLFYGNSSTSPEEFTGFSTRYASLTAEIGQNIIDAGGIGSDNSSIWLITWGANTVTGIFPKGSKAGLIHEDLGIGDAFDSDNNRFRAYMERWQWKPGIALRDWRYAVRIANIDISNLVAKSSAADLTELMIKAMHRIPYLGMGKPAFYVNRTVMEMLDIQRRDDIISGGGLTWDTVDGKRQASFRGIPVRLVDQLLQSEAQVT